MSQILYLIGEPGVGKSTALYGALKDVEHRELPDPFLHVGYLRADRQPNETHYRGFQLGGTGDGPFRGVDRLPMNVQAKVIAWLGDAEHGPWAYHAIVAEGDRLANKAFFDAVVAQGHDLRILYFLADDEETARRRAYRAKELGRPEQNAAWVKGRATKCARLAADFNVITEIVDADQPRDQIITRLREEPVIQWLRGER